MSEIIKFYPANAADNPDSVLEQAIGVYEDVLIFGYDKEGDFDARASTGLTHADINWIIDTFKTKLLNGDYEPDE